MVLQPPLYKEAPEQATTQPKTPEIGTQEHLQMIRDKFPQLDAKQVPQLQSQLDHLNKNEQLAPKLTPFLTGILPSLKIEEIPSLLQHLTTNQNYLAQQTITPLLLQQTIGQLRTNKQTHLTTPNETQSLPPSIEQQKLPTKALNTLGLPSMTTIRFATKYNQRFHLFSEQQMNAEQKALYTRLKSAFTHPVLKNRFKTDSAINKQLTSYLNYQLYLHFLEQNPNEIRALRTTEKPDIADFQQLLQQQGISTESFYQIFTLDPKAVTTTATAKSAPIQEKSIKTTVKSTNAKGTGKSIAKAASKYAQVTSSNANEKTKDTSINETAINTPSVSKLEQAPKGKALSANLANDPEININNLDSGNIFEGINDAELLDNMPLPEGMSEDDFLYIPAQEEKFIKRMKTLMATKNAFPMLNNAGSAEEEQAITQRVIIWNILEHNPTLTTFPEGIRKALFEGQDSKLEQDLIDKPPMFVKEQLEKTLILPLLKNNITNNDIKEYASEGIKQGYLSYITSLLEETPGLDALSYDPSKITIENTKMTIPLISENNTTMILTIEDGTMHITNPFYNPQDSNAHNQFSKGTVFLGQVRDFSDFSRDIRRQMPNILESSLQKDNPNEALYEEFDTVVSEEIRKSSDTKLLAQSSTAHTISQIQTRDATKDLMYSWHSDGAQDIRDSIKQGPFYHQLYSYENDRDSMIKKTEQPDLFGCLNILRSTSLSNSASDNQQLNQSLKTLTSLLQNADFNRRLSHYLNSEMINEESKTDTAKVAILRLLDPSNRKNNPEKARQQLRTLLQLFGKPLRNHNTQNETLNTQNLVTMISRLVQSSNFEHFQCKQLIPESHYILQDFVEKQEKATADYNLQQALNTMA